MAVLFLEDKKIRGLPAWPQCCRGKQPRQYIPVAIPDTTTYPGCDYYEIELGEYSEKLHSDLPATRLRGYRQTNTNDATVSQFVMQGL